MSDVHISENLFLLGTYCNTCGQKVDIDLQLASQKPKYNQYCVQRYKYIKLCKSLMAIKDND